MARRRLTNRERDVISRADAALRDARNDPRPFAPLGPYARKHHTTVATIRKRFPGAVRMGPSRRLVANPTDRGRRIRPIVADGHVRYVETRGSEAARRAERVWKAQYAFARDPTPEHEAELERVAGQRIAGHTVDTDPDLLLLLSDAGEFGELDLSETYRELFG